MTIRIIKNDEVLEHSTHGATFKYRRIPAHVRAKIVRDNTAKRSGNVDWGKASLAMLNYALTGEGCGWEGVVDGTGKDVPLTQETISYLPDVVQSELMELLGENAELESELKNSKASQPSKP